MAKRDCVALLCVLAAAACGDDQPSPEFKTDGDYLAVVGPDGPEPFYVKGVNLGVGIPGTYPGELALDRETYLRWFERMREIGVNTVRIYTLHHPTFYEALFEFNNFRPDSPIYVLHGTWLDEDNPTGGLDLYDLTESFDTAIEEVVDAVHGNASIEHRLGRGFGDYTVDISRWVAAYIIGREVYPAEVLTTNLAHSGDVGFSGSYLSIADATPSEAWVTARMDHVLDYEGTRYDEHRPLGFSSWPTLDPLFHRTEPHFLGDENLVEGGEDDASIDITRIDASRAPAGLFVSYHAYPYYPDFVYREPNYLEAIDHVGPSNYLGYLRDLKSHYQDMPLLILEYGVPSSWGNAHSSPLTGMSHGGHDEAAQAAMNARLTRNIADAGCGGGSIFSWMDEWWKLTWVVEERAYPIERFPLWNDVLSPEEHFGLIAFDLPAPTFDLTPPRAGQGQIASIDVDIDASYFHVRVDLASPLLDSDTIEIGFDTHRDDLGESVLPSGLVTEARAEIAVVIDEARAAQLYVTEVYDLFGLAKGLAGPWQTAQSAPSDGAPWKPWIWVTAEAAASNDGQFAYPLVTSNEGALRVRVVGAAPTSLDAIVIGETRVDLRIPWTLLQFSDPSAAEVVRDDRSTPFRLESMTSDGVRLTVRVGASSVTTARVTWPTWDAPPATLEREKPAMEAFAQALRELPLL